MLCRKESDFLLFLSLVLLEKKKKLNTLTSKKPLEVRWIKEAKEQSNSEGAVRWMEGLQEEGGRRRWKGGAGRQVLIVD